MKKAQNIVYTQSIQGAQTYDLMPKYSYDCIRFIYEIIFHNIPVIIADIGSGTGRLSSQLLFNNFVYGVEPDSNMRLVAENKFERDPNFKSINATAENTTLKDDSIDFITVGQAFHRFDLDKFRKEADRILKNKDHVIILWNRIYYDREIFMELLKLIKESYTEYVSRYVCEDELKGSKLEVQQNDEIAFGFYHGECKKRTFDNPCVLTYEMFYNLCYSLWLFPLSNGDETQSILSSDAFNHEHFQSRLKDIYKRFNCEGKIVLPLETDLYYG